MIDFSWFYFIGKSKLGLSFSETGRLTLTLFNKLYQHYKDNFDLELMLEKTATTYEKLRKKARKSEEWF